MVGEGWRYYSASRRDRLIGCGALAYGLLWVPYVVIFVLNTSWSETFPSNVDGAIVTLALLAGYLAGIVGFGLVGLALIRGGEKRDPRVRQGALVVAWSYFLHFVAALYSTIRVGIGDIPGNVGAMFILAVLEFLALVLTWLLLGRVFGPGPAGSRGASAGRRFWWTGSAFAAASALGVAGEMAAWSQWDPSLTLEAASFWAQVLAFGAAAMASLGFFRRARGSERPVRSGLSERDRLLVYAGVLLVASGVLRVLYCVLQVPIPVEEWGSWRWDEWSMCLLPGIRLAVAASLAALGVGLSGRLPKPEGGQPPPAVAASRDSGYNP